MKEKEKKENEGFDFVEEKNDNEIKENINEEEKEENNNGFDFVELLKQHLVKIQV